MDVGKFTVKFLLCNFYIIYIIYVILHNFTAKIYSSSSARCCILIIVFVPSYSLVVTILFISESALIFYCFRTLTV